jgi:hypothetical protein
MLGVDKCLNKEFQDIRSKNVLQNTEQNRTKQNNEYPYEIKFIQLQ